MKSRYDYMAESDQLDIDGMAFPDPLSIKFGSFQLSQAPTGAQLSLMDLKKFWKFMEKAYGIVEKDDLLLSQNGVQYLTDLEPGDSLFLFPESVLEPEKLSIINLK